MSEALLKKLQNDQQRMTGNAMRTVLITAFCIHLLLNAFAYYNPDPILKIEMPILSGITIVAIFVTTKVFKHQ